MQDKSEETGRAAAKGDAIGALVETAGRVIMQPGANLESLAAALVAAHGVDSKDAMAISRTICDRLLGSSFPPITEMELMLTEACNHCCTYCFVEGKNEAHPMPEAVLRRGIDFLFDQCRDAETVKVLFFGGEPMMEYELIRLGVQHAQARAAAAGNRVAFNMTTNGTLIDEERMAFLAGHGVLCLLSIDGDRDTHDRFRKRVGGGSSYDQVAARIPIIKKYQPWLGARMTVHPDMVDRLVDNVQHLAGLGINQFIIGIATGMDWTDEQLDAYTARMIDVAHWLREQLDAGRMFRVTAFEETEASLNGRRHVWGCRAGRHSITVTSRGELYPCSKMLGLNGLKGVYPLGTLEEGITEIYNRLALCGLVPIDRPQCRQCAFVDTCMGGCFATNYGATGCIFKPDPRECRLKARTTAITREAHRILGTWTRKDGSSGYVRCPDDAG